MSTLLAIAMLLASAPEGPVAVLTRAVPRGASVDESNVRLADPKELELPRHVQPHPWREGERLRARRALALGAVLSRYDVEPMPDIAAGDRVIIQVLRGRLRITASAVAQEDGHAGGTIWVENPSSSRRLRVRVVEPGLVALDSPWGNRR